MAIKERTFSVVKRFLEPLCSNQKKYWLNEILLIDVYFFLLKYRKFHFVIFYPKEKNIIKKNLPKLKNIEGNEFDQLQRRVYFEISLLNIQTGIVLNIRFFAENKENLE